jgi:pimeloyl-ACP methyl ester carboxylesterase
VHKVIGELAQDYDVIVPDLRGYGDSEKPDLDDASLYTLEHAIDDMTRCWARWISSRPT